MFVVVPVRVVNCMVHWGVADALWGIVRIRVLESSMRHIVRVFFVLFASYYTIRYATRHTFKHSQNNNKKALNKTIAEKGLKLFKLLSKQGPCFSNHTFAFSLNAHFIDIRQDVNSINFNVSSVRKSFQSFF